MPDVQVWVWRGDASGGDFLPYKVAADEGMVVLDVVHRIQAEKAPDLAVRWNCKAGKCGSCSAEINGHPKLMCMTRMNEFPAGEHITVSPVKTFPVIKDLVTDVSFNYEKAKTIPPFKPKPKDPDGKRRMYQEDVERVQEFHKCIECFLCQDVCHVIRDHEENKESFSARDSSCGSQLSRCIRSTRTTASISSGRSTASASATSPSAAQRCAPRTSTSPTTRSSRSRSAL